MKQNVIKTWWKRTSTGTKVISFAPFAVIIPFYAIGFSSSFPREGWIVGSLISAGIIGLAIWSNIKDYKKNK